MNAFESEYPTLCELLAGTEFDGDASLAIALVESPNDLKSAFQGGEFCLNELMWLICGAVVPDWMNPEGTRLEQDLQTVVSAVGMDAVKNAFKDKLLVEAKSRIQDPDRKTLDAKNKLEDIRYELVVTAKACETFDSGSIQLERPIPDPAKQETHWKNSDVYGEVSGQPVRIEVTVLHESLPPAIHGELDEYVRESEVTSGFEVTLRSVLVDQGYAERTRALIELLHDNHVSTGGETLEVDGVRFEWEGGAYHCRQETSPFESICFYAADEFSGAETLRNIIHPCSERAVTPQHIIEDNPNPPGVFTSADLPDAPTQVPVSTKIRQMLSGKLQQCEEGLLNIVAFGNPQQMHDDEVESALLGAPSVGVQFWTDKHGVRHSGKAFLQRSSKAPFVPADRIEDDDDRMQFVDPFKKLSAVWHLRLGTYAKSTMISNPNAAIAIPSELLTRFSDPAPQDTGDKVAEAIHPPSEVDEVDASDVDIVWTEVARDFVDVCGTIAEAKSLVVELEQSQQTFDDLRANDDQVWSEPRTRDEGPKVLSPTNEEIAVRFVVNCGGYGQAKTCLELYENEIQQTKTDDTSHL